MTISGSTQLASSPAPAAPAPEPARRSPWPALAIVLAAHLAVAWFSRPFPQWADPTLVFEYARLYPDVPLDQHALRLGTLLPARAAMDLLGYGLVAYYIFPFLMGLLLVGSTFALGELLFGRAVALAAATLIVFNPFIVQSAEYVTGWQLMPDIPAAALFTAAVVCVLHAARVKDRSRLAEASFLVAAGTLFGWAYLCREYTVFLFPLVLLLFVAWRLRWSRLAYVAVPMLGALVLELTRSQAVYGDPLARLDVASAHGGALPDPVTRLEAVLVGARALNHPTVGPLLVALLVAAVVGAAIRRRQHVLLAAWVLLLYVPIMLLAGLLDPDTVSLRGWLPRYWTLTYPAVAIGGTAAMLVGWRRIRAATRPALRRPASWAAGVLVAGLLVWYAVPTQRAVTSDAGDPADWRQVTEWLTEHQGEIDEVWTDTRTNQTLRIFQRGLLGGDLLWERPVGRYAARGDGAGYPEPSGDERIALIASPVWGPLVLPGPGTAWQRVFTAGDIVVYVSAG